MISELLLDTMTIKQVPLAEKIRITAAAGYDAIELRGNDLVEWTQAGRSLAELSDQIAQYGLTAPSVCTEVEVYHWHHGEPMEDSEFTHTLDHFLDQCQRLDSDMLFFPVMDANGTLDETMRNYAWLCDRAAEFDLIVGLEFIGHIPKVPDVQTAWGIVEAVDRPNSGIVVDLFHFYRGGSTLEDLAQVPPDKIAIVHIDDAMPLPREQLIGSQHRLYPGEGIIPVRQILDMLQQRGYRGLYAIELFNEEYWSSDPLTVARRAREAALKMLGVEEAS